MNRFDKIYKEIKECLIIEENSLELFHRKVFTV